MPKEKPLFEEVPVIYNGSLAELNSISGRRHYDLIKGKKRFVGHYRKEELPNVSDELSRHGFDGLVNARMTYAGHSTEPRVGGGLEHYFYVEGTPIIRETSDRVCPA